MVRMIFEVVVVPAAGLGLWMMKAGAQENYFHDDRGDSRT